MQILFLNPLETIILDLIAWVMFHLGIGYTTSKIPLERFDPDKNFFQTFPWEKNGKIYQELFHVRSWKNLIPQGSRLYPNTFSMQHLPATDPGYLQHWLRESIRAEFCHWMMIIPGFVFFLWNDTFMGWMMVFYAAFNNFFPIVLQRFNRPRVREFLEKVREKSSPIGIPYSPEDAGYTLAGLSIR